MPLGTVIPLTLGTIVFTVGATGWARADSKDSPRLLSNLVTMLIGAFTFFAYLPIGG